MVLKLEIEELEQRIAPSVAVDAVDVDIDANKNHVNTNGTHVNANHPL